MARERQDSRDITPRSPLRRSDRHEPRHMASRSGSRPPAGSDVPAYAPSASGGNGYGGAGGHVPATGVGSPTSDNAPGPAWGAESSQWAAPAAPPPAAPATGGHVTLPPHEVDPRHADPSPPRGGPRGPVPPTVHPPEPPESPSPDLVFKRRMRPLAMLRELLGSGELVRALTERDFRARYKQTKVGFAWALLTPLLLMVAFSLFFKTAADIDTGDIPYPLFSFVALVPWTLFSNSVSTGAVSITQNLSLVNKVYCPREVFPLSSIGIAAVDAFISLFMLALLFVIYGEAPQPETAWVLVLLPIQLAFTIGVTLLLSALVVYLRDVRQILPMALQFALFATPVAYAFDVLDEKWQPLASAVNPLAPIIDSYRQTVLYGQAPQGDLLAIAAGVSLVWLVGGYLLFKRLETGFADVA